jgi:hypothetical protein
MGTEGLEGNAWGWVEWTSVLMVNVPISVAIGIGVAMLVRWLATSQPNLKMILQLLPWRGVTALLVLAFMPDVLLATSMPTGGVWSEIVSQLLAGDNTLELLSVVSIVSQISFLATAFTAAMLVGHWMPDSLPNLTAATLRTFAVFVGGLAIAVQISSVSPLSGLGSDLIRSYHELDLDAVRTAWLQIVYFVLTVDMVFGIGQFATMLLNKRNERSALDR